MAELTTGQIAEILDAKGQLPQPDEKINKLLLDSRQYSAQAGQLFFALKGDNHDGHKYVSELQEKGVRSFVVEELPEQLFPDTNFLLVMDVKASLQKLAQRVRENSAAKIIGITGSNGKTIVKEWLSAILQHQYKVCKNPKSYNSQVGVPLSLWRLEQEHQIGVFEAGISKPGEMQLLEHMLRPELGIFTNIGTAHDINFESKTQKIREKLQLFKNCKKLVYKKGGGELSAEIEDFASAHNLKLLSWSDETAQADLFVEGIISERGGSTFKGQFRNEVLELWIPFSDEASCENALHCWRMALELGMDHTVLQSAFSQLEAVEMRLEMKEGINDALIINDAYNADLESLKVALHLLESQGKKRSKVLVLSDMLQIGYSAEDLYGRVAAIIDQFELDQVIGIGENLHRHGLTVKTPVDTYPSTTEFLSNIFRYRFAKTAILLKGARSYRFEQISQRLEARSHETVFNIYFDRLVENLNYFRSLLKPQTKVMAMVKAFSYGSGSYEVANLLEFHKVDYLGVAYTDEGVDLRKAGITTPIMVLNPEWNSFDDLISHDLEPEIYSFEQLRQLGQKLNQHNQSSEFKIHIKLETGLNRLGFTESELEELITALRAFPQLKVASAFSHLAASDDPAEKEFTQLQISRLRSMSGKLEGGLGYSFMRHIANSSGISRYPEAHFEMVRLGVGLYGISPDKKERQKLKVASELKATVSQLKQLKAGDSVSYSRSFIASGPMTIAVVSIGYADGFRRSLSNGVGEVSIKGRRYSVVGRVCMDMIMIDVSDSEVKEGDTVEVFGTDISIYELAERMGTIPYEVLTGIGRRIKRVYYME